MHNDPELSGRYLGTITQDFVKISETLKEASYQIRVRKISEYPIFPISRFDIPVGKLLIGRRELNGGETSLEWNYYISFLDEFVQRQLVAEDKVEDFKSVYKNPEEFCCLFVVDEDFTNFLFVPYPED